jgi:hypothetical protein
MREVRKERTGWRDVTLSERHRLWGWDSPAVDLDFLFLEYDKGKAVALVEYKHEMAAPQTSAHPTYQAMADLANRAEIPLFACRYKGDFSEFKATPLTPIARQYMASPTPLTEAGWVSFLYKIRGRTVPESVISGLIATEI